MGQVNGHVTQWYVDIVKKFIFRMNKLPDFYIYSYY